MVLPHTRNRKGAGADGAKRQAASRSSPVDCFVAPRVDSRMGHQYEESKRCVGAITNRPKNSSELHINEIERRGDYQSPEK